MNKAVLVFPWILLSLLVAVWSGWLRIGWSLPLSNVAGTHGAIMVNSFLASLIFLERAVTFKNKAVLLVPLVNALSIVGFLSGMPGLAYALLVAGSGGFVGICIYFASRYKELHYFIFLGSAACLLLGNILLLKTQAYPASVTWWIGFLLLTIVAERLELSRFLSLTRTKRALLLVSLAVVLAGLLLPLTSGAVAMLATGIGATALWLLKYDMARHSIKAAGQHRYSGLLLLTGYVWLLIMAVLLLVQDRFAFGYDAVLHSFFIGFVFSMIFSHAPIILPAVSRLPVKIYRPLLYVWFVLLQVSLTVRIVADMAGAAYLRKMAGLANGLAILLFFASIALIVAQEQRRRSLKS